MDKKTLRRFLTEFKKEMKQREKEMDRQWLVMRKAFLAQKRQKELRKQQGEWRKQKRFLRWKWNEEFGLPEREWWEDATQHEERKQKVWLEKLEKRNERFLAMKEDQGLYSELLVGQ